MEDPTSYYPDVVYGSLLSLYDALDISTVLQLESAILHRNLRDFDKALDIFDDLARGVRFSGRAAVIVLEYTWTLIAQYRFKEARDVAAGGLAALANVGRLDGRGQDVGPAIVLRAFVAGLDALIEGTTNACYKSLAEIYQWLAPVAVPDFTDVQ
ncbi:MAG: hypothetical protein LQ346_008685, partial [Caloplaca aetnensis]